MVLLCRHISDLALLPAHPELINELYNKDRLRNVFEFQARKVIEETMKNVHPIYNIKVCDVSKFLLLNLFCRVLEETKNVAPPPPLPQRE